MRRSLAVLVLCAPLAACGGGAPAPESPAAFGPPPPETPPPGTAVAAAGTLRHDAIEPNRKSVEAYMGREFVVVADGRELFVQAKDAATREQLLALTGKRVLVTCVVEEAAKPDPMSSYPVGAGGEPLARPDACVIETLRAE